MLSLRGIGEHLKFGLTLVGNRVSYFVVVQSDVLIGSAFLSTTEIGRYSVALQLASAVVITGFVAVALVSLSLGHGVIRARLLVADGVIGGLGVMTAATLLRTIGLRTWHQILMFTLILFLRILLKKLFVWEKQRLFQDPA